MSQPSHSPMPARKTIIKGSTNHPSHAPSAAPINAAILALLRETGRRLLIGRLHSCGDAEGRVSDLAQVQKNRTRGAERDEKYQEGDEKDSAADSSQYVHVRLPPLSVAASAPAGAGPLQTPPANACDIPAYSSEPDSCISRRPDSAGLPWCLRAPSYQSVALRVRFSMIGGRESSAMMIR